jgi:Na+/proline symporter
MTIPAAIGARYRSPSARGLAATAILVATVGYMATNILALGLVIRAVTPLSLGPAIWTGALVTLAYSATGGILAGVYTDVFQGTLMAIASVCVFVLALHTGGGLAEITRTIVSHEPQFMSAWGSMQPVAALSLFLVFGLGALGQPHVLHKFYMLKDPARLRWYPVVMTVALTLTLLLFFGVGLSVKALALQGRIMLPSPDDATPQFLLHYTPPMIAGLVFAGVVAAIMSTMNSFMNVGAAAVTLDLPAAWGESVENELLVGRIATVMITLIAALAAQLSGTLVAFLGIFGWGLFTSTLVPALAVGLNWEGATRAGAIASIATGLVVTLFFETLGFFRILKIPGGVSVSAVALVLSLLVFFVVSWLTRAQAAAQIDADVREIMEA